MAQKNPKYETHIHGYVQGVVIGDGNTVPLLVPPRPSYDLITFDRELRLQLVEGINAFSHFMTIRSMYDLAETHLERAA